MLSVELINSVPLFSFPGFLPTAALLFTYMWLYNVSLLVFFWTMQQFVNSDFCTLYSLRDLRLDFFFILAFTVVFLSIAGVPPFLGFFAKLLILLGLVYSDFFFFYIVFFGLLFLGLYFYLQNIRFLYAMGRGRAGRPLGFSSRVSVAYYWVSAAVLFLLAIGGAFFEDVTFFFLWLFL